MIPPFLKRELDKNSEPVLVINESGRLTSEMRDAPNYFAIVLSLIGGAIILFLFAIALLAITASTPADAYKSSSHERDIAGHLKP